MLKRRFATHRRLRKAAPRGSFSSILTARLLKAKADWQNTFDSIADLVCILDLNGRITRVNKAFSQRMGLPYQSIIGNSCAEVIHKGDPPPGCMLREVIETGEPASDGMELKIGDSIYATSIFPFYDSTNRICGAVHIFRDITEQKALKERLVQSEKMAAIGQLVAEIAHDINNPLDYITNYLYLLSESLPEDFEHREYLRKIETGIDNLAALTRDMLEFARPQIDAYLPVDIHHIIENAFEFSGRYLSEGRVEVIRSFCCSGVKVMGSEQMLLQVFLNLILNSIDAMPNGGTITVATACRGNNIIVEFSDTGSGIPEKNISRIFEPFFTTKKSSEKRGTGLGLTICYNIIHQHKGEISVESTVGKGTTFTINFPLAV